MSKINLTILCSFLALILINQGALTCAMDLSNDEGGEEIASSKLYDSPPTDKSSPISTLPAEVMVQIFENLPIKSVLKASEISRRFYEQAQISIMGRMTSCITDMKTPSLFQNSNENQWDMAQLLRNSPEDASLYQHLLLETLTQQGVLFAPKNPSLGAKTREILLQSGLKLEDGDNPFFLNALFPKCEQPTLFHRVVAQDLLRHFKVYVSPNQEKNVLGKEFKEALIQQVKSLQEERLYVSFADIKEENELHGAMPHRIVMTMDELFNPINKTRLQRLLAINSEHKIILAVSAAFVNHEEGFMLPVGHLLNNLKYLILSDPDHLVKSLRSHFLYNCMSLTHFDSFGFTALERIDRYFLKNCTSLTHFASSDFTALKDIEWFFLQGCTSLTHFDGSGFRALKNLGHFFLCHCTSLTHLDVSAFEALENIGAGTLMDCTLLQEITVLHEEQKILLESQMSDALKERITWSQGW